MSDHYVYDYQCPDNTCINCGIEIGLKYAFCTFTCFEEYQEKLARRKKNVHKDD